jgi:hypothetical protein
MSESTIPVHWLNIATSIERFEAGDNLSILVTGGCVGRAMPCSGLLVTMRDESQYIVPDDLPEPPYDDVEGTAAHMVKLMQGLDDGGRKRLFDLLEWHFCHRCGNVLALEENSGSEREAWPERCQNPACT